MHDELGVDFMPSIGDTCLQTYFITQLLIIKSAIKEHGNIQGT
jgi:hypothetical protein